MPVRLNYLSLTFCLGLASFVQSQIYISGTVFPDHNPNDIRDAKENEINCIYVSNGRDTVEINDDGTRGLSVGNKTSTFITWPAKYIIPVNSDEISHHCFLFRKNSYSPPKKQFILL